MDRSRLFRREQVIRFLHCDPAGIVYYPKYFDMFQALVEDWLTHRLGINYADFISRRRLGLPTVHIDCDFILPSKIGDMVAFYVAVKRIGRSSLAIEVEGAVGEEVRLRAHQVLVATSLDTGKAIPLPEDLLRAVTDYQTSVKGEA